MPQEVKDITGKKYGRLTALSFYEIKNRQSYWKCICECGNYIIIMKQSLTRSRPTKSCGCLSREHAIENCKKNHREGKTTKLPLGEASRNVVYAFYKKNALKRSIVFEISLEEFTSISQEDCHYCGSKPTPYRLNSPRCNGPYIGNGIDRKDNFRGYVFKNCLPCCYFCNKTKSNLSYDEFVAWIHKTSSYLVWGTKLNDTILDFRLE